MKTQTQATETHTTNRAANDNGTRRTSRLFAVELATVWTKDLTPQWVKDAADFSGMNANAIAALRAI